jgi:hypothetical protein
VGARTSHNPLASTASYRDSFLSVFIYAATILNDF